MKTRPFVLFYEKVSLYNAYFERFGHQLINVLDGQEIQSLLENIVSKMDKIWRFNQSARPALELALDGQLSNWVWLENADSQAMVFIDTSTPLFRQKRR